MTIFTSEDFAKFNEFSELVWDVTHDWMAALGEHWWSFDHISEINDGCVVVICDDRDGDTKTFTLPFEWFNLSRAVPEGGKPEDSELRQAMKKAAEEFHAEESRKKEAEREAYKQREAARMAAAEEATINRLRQTRPELFV